MKKQKIFPAPVEPYDVVAHLEQIEADKATQIDHYLWSARVAGILCGMVLWGVIFLLVFGLWLGGNYVTANTLISSFAIGAGLAFCFSVPFLWK